MLSLGVHYAGCNPSTPDRRLNNDLTWERVSF